ncbi:MAG: hypothetical protein ACR2LJ_04510 [Acidimicrobiales bacterium]
MELVGEGPEPPGIVGRLRSTMQHPGSAEAPKRPSGGVLADADVDGQSASAGGHDQDAVVIGAGVQAQIGQHRPGRRTDGSAQRPLPFAGPAAIDIVSDATNASTARSSSVV